MDDFHGSDNSNKNRAKPYKGRMKLIQNQLQTIKGNDIYTNIGVDYSLFFVTYVLAIIEAAHKEQVHKIYYFTREGEFFKRIHDKLAQTNIFDFPVPESELLEVSRMATFAPSIHEVSINGMMRLWSQYPNQSLDAFFKSLNIDIQTYMHHLKKYGLEDIYKPLKEIYHTDRVLRLFQDDCFVTQLKVEIIEKRSLLLRYLEQKGIYTTLKKIFVVDIGWRGSIQDNLAMLFPNTEVVGYYMGIFRPYYKKIPNTRKLQFTFSDERDDYLWYFRHPFPIEIYSNSINGSVVGYSEMKDGYIKAMRKNYDDEDIVFHPYIMKFQEGIISAIPIYEDIIQKEGLDIAALKPHAMKKIKELMIRPNKMFSKPFFELAYNNMYGDGELTKLATKYNVITLFKDVISPRGLMGLRDYLEKSHWPHAIFMKNHLHLLNWLYSKSEQKIYRHYSCLEPLRYNNKVRISFNAYRKINIEVIYKKEEFKYNQVCNYYRSTVIIPNSFANQYEILISIKNRFKTVFFNTTQIVTNGLSGRDEICFEAKIPRNSNSFQSVHQLVIINPQDLTYMLLDL